MPHAPFRPRWTGPAALPKLGVGDGFVWCPGADFLQRMRFPAITTFDSGRTPEHGEQVPEPAQLADVDLSGVLEALKPAEPQEAKPGRAARPDPAVLEQEFARGHRAGFQQGRAGVDIALAGMFELIRAANTAVDLIRKGEVPVNRNTDVDFLRAFLCEARPASNEHCGGDCIAAPCSNCDGRPNGPHD